MNQTDTIDLGTETMSVYEFARWAALYEAVTIIANKCEQRGIDFDSDRGLKYIKPLDILDYVDSRVDSMKVTIEKSREFEFANSTLQIQKIHENIRMFKCDEGLPI